MKKIIFSIFYFYILAQVAYSQSVTISPTGTNHIQVGRNFLWQSSSDNKKISFGDGQFVSIGEEDADDRMVFNANNYHFKGGKVGIGTNNFLARFNTNPINGTSPTSAVFGTDNTGISIQQNWPTIGYNQYRDDSNIQKFIGTGFAGLNTLHQGNGYFYWVGLGNGTAGSTITTNNNLMSLSNIGKLGLSTIGDPHAWIHLPPTIENKKLILYENPTNNDQHQFYGFGIQNGQMNYHVDSPIASHVFYAATSATTSDEIMRVNGNGSFAAGAGNSLSVVGAMAIGTGNTITSPGAYSTAIGIYNEVNGQVSTVIGQNIDMAADRALAFGQNINIGSAADGTVTFADNSTATPLNLNVGNYFFGRFANGYGLYTNSTYTTGVFMNAGANSWSSISDRNKKENFETIDSEKLLQKASKIPSSTWNYKGQDAKTFRHYGPMAQDFFAAFGKDKYGVIGNDTTIASADFDGINFVLIQALEKRTRDLQSENDKLKSQITDFQVLAAKLERIEAMLSDKEKIRVSDK